MIDLTYEIEWQYLVGRVNADTSHLKGWQKWIFNWIYRPFARFCHFRLKLPTTTQIVGSVKCVHCGRRTVLPYEGYRIEFQAICTSKDRATQMVKVGGSDYFAQQLPKDFSLPSDNIRVGEAEFLADGPDRNFQDKKPVWVLH